MKKVHYDHTELLHRINMKYGDYHKLCEAAGLDPIDFTIHMYDSDFTADEIKACVKLLDIPQEEIGFYFFRPDENWIYPGRPRKDNLKTTTPPENPRYYTISEAAELLAVHRHTLQARLREGKIKGKLIGRTWRIYRDELFDNTTHLYYFDCNDATYGEKYLTPSQCNQLANGTDEPLTEGAIIALAKNLEATLYRCNSDKSQQVMIYDCEI